MTPNRSTWLALLALPTASLPDASAVARELTELEPDDEPAIVSSTTPGMATLGWGESVLAYTLVPRPITSEQLAGPCECAWYWPMASVEMSQHRAHLIVALIDDSRRALANCKRMTKYMQALIDNIPSIGLQWGASRQVHQAQAFRDLAAVLNDDDLPLHLWIDFRVENNEHGGLRLFTTGLLPLGHNEIEVRHFAGDPNALMGHVYNVAHYLVLNDKTLRDGEGLGLADGTQVLVREGESMLGDGQTVCELVWE